MAFPSIGKTLLGTAALSLPGLALAHTGADAGAHHLAGFSEGLAHPFTGMDHLAAMVAVGIWSAMTARRVWVAPLSFASLLLIGALLGVAGVALPAVEPMIAASLLVLGLLMSTRASLPAGASALLAGGFALFHGLAHGTELAAAHSVVGALAGMVLGTALLHVAGLAIGHTMTRTNAWCPRVLGGGVALLGAGFLAGVA